MILRNLEKKFDNINLKANGCEKYAESFIDFDNI